jgi:hypothetical protein
MRFSITLDITLKYTRILFEIPAKIFKIPLTLPLSPAFAEAASRRQASGEREGVRGTRQSPLIQNGIFDSMSIKFFQKSGGALWRFSKRQSPFVKIGSRSTPCDAGWIGQRRIWKDLRSWSTMSSGTATLEVST